MKKIVAFAGFALLSVGAFAQTNLQVFYDFGKDRKQVTSTLEMFKGDDWGNTFFFVDYDHVWKNADDKILSPGGTYMEIARCFNFWGESALAPLSLQVEYNGGFGEFGNGAGAYPIEKAWLFGVDYFLHNSDFSNTFNIKVLYKHFPLNKGIPVQFTGVWGMQNLFGVEGLRFSGFADLWGQDASYITKYDATTGLPSETKDTKWVFISEPQIWYSVGQFFNCPNLNLGCEFELSYNFTQYGFMFNPCIGAKWDF